MKPHKWAKEIKAWADGAEIEYYAYDVWSDWHPDIGWFEDYEYRIKPQPKEPKYLYVFQTNAYDYRISTVKPAMDTIYHGKYVGKIKLEIEE